MIKVTALEDSVTLEIEDQNELLISPLLKINMATNGSYVGKNIYIIGVTTTIAAASLTAVLVGKVASIYFYEVKLSNFVKVYQKGNQL